MEATSNAVLVKSGSTSGSLTKMLATLPDALGAALGRVIVDLRREARNEIETIKVCIERSSLNTVCVLMPRSRS